MVMVKVRKMRQHNMIVLRVRKMTDMIGCERLKQKVFVKKARDRSRSAMNIDDHSTDLPPVGKYKENRKDNAWLNESTQTSYWPGMYCIVQLLPMATITPDEHDMTLTFYQNILPSLKV